MRLSEYLKSNGIPQIEFARKIRVTQAAVSRYADGLIFPSPDVLIRIEKATRGAVTAMDLLAERKAQGTVK